MVLFVYEEKIIFTFPSVFSPTFSIKTRQKLFIDGMFFS